MRKSFLALTLLVAIAAAAAAQARPRVAVVFSGGSALGIAHIGVLKAIEKAGIPIDMVLGTSMGAIVGGLYAAGYSPDQLEGIVTRLDWDSVFSERRDSPADRYDRLKRQRLPLRLGFDADGIHIGTGFLKGQNVLTFLTELSLHSLTTRDFDKLPVPFRAVAADVMTGDKVVFSRGSIAEAMRASMSIPGVFDPYDLDGRFLVDGGIVDDMPVDIARSMGADIVIAVESRSHVARSPKELKSGIAVTVQTLRLFVEQNLRPSRADADILIRPDLSGFNSTSYADAEEIAERGVEAGEAAGPALAALAARIAKSRLLVRPEDQANRRAYRDPPVIAQLRSDGRSPEDEAAVREAFAPLVGRAPRREEVKAAIDSLFASGRYDLVRLDLLPEPGEGEDRALGVVHLVPSTTPENALMFGTTVHAVYSAYTASETVISPAIILRDVTVRDSALYAEAALVGKTRAYVEYHHPFDPFFFMPYFKYESQFVSYALNETASTDVLYRSLGGGAWLGLTLSRHADILEGYSLENAKGASGVYGLGALSTALRVDTRATSVFPEQGFSALARLRWADPRLGGEVSFTSAELGTTLALPLSRKTSLGIGAFAGTDFSDFLPVKGELPPERFFSIRTPGSFYGLEPQAVRGLGDSVASLSLELRLRVGRVNSLLSLLGGDLFTIANASVGAVDVTGDPKNSFLPLRWNGSVGFGMRLEDRIGVLVAAGVVGDDDPAAPIRPALSLELGTFGDFLEDLR